MVLEDLVLSEVHCAECNKPISSIPAWLSNAKVKFQCEDCRQKHPRVPGMADIESRKAVVVAASVPDPVEPDEEIEIDEAEDDTEEPE